MNVRPALSRRAAVVLPVAVALAVFVLRVWDVTRYNLVLRDQMRDWDIVQGTFGSLPLLGPATHVGGYTIGPGFYWILWAIRVLFGPWFDYLPHAGGIGQAALQSAVDALLFVAIRRRTTSPWLALGAVTLIATSAFDLSFAATIWNPVVGSTLAKAAVALVLLDWHVRGRLRQVALMGVAWLAVHAYTGAIYVTVGVGMAIVLVPTLRRDWRETARSIASAAAAVFVLQVPYFWFQLTTSFRTAAMGAVTSSVGRIVTGQAAPEFSKSVSGLVEAFRTIQVAPHALPGAGLLLLVAAAVTVVRHRRDPALLCVTVVPPTLAVAGYALFLSALDAYYYLSLMTPVVLMVVLAASAWPARIARYATVCVAVGALLLVPSRFERSTRINRMPQYEALVRASRVLVHRQVPLRGVRTTFRLPPTGRPQYIYELLGGKLDRTSRWVATIDEHGDVTYEDLGGA